MCDILSHIARKKLWHYNHEKLWKKENTTTTIRLAVTKHYRPPLDQQKSYSYTAQQLPTNRLTPSTYKM